MDDFEKEFILEAVEEISDNLERFFEIISKLEKGLEVSDVYNEIFRLVHNVKGNSKSAGFDSFSTVVHALETNLLPFREGEKTFSKNDIEILDSCYSELSNSLDEIKINLICEEDFSNLFQEIEKLGDVKAIEVEESTSPSLDQADKFESNNIVKKEKYSFLVVDDEEAICEVLSEHLSDAFECEVCTLYDGESALNSCLENKYDLIITDYNMPKMNGLEFLEGLRKGSSKNIDTPVIFSSGYNPDLTPDSDLWENVLILNKVIDFKKLNFNIHCLLHSKKAA